MSTRAVIAIPDGSGGYYGRYCHSDGYPSHLGREILGTVNHFGGDLAASIQYAVKPEELGCWSSYANPALGGSWVEDLEHGALLDIDDTDAEWAYVITYEGLKVLTGGVGEWRRVATVAWNSGVQKPDAWA